MTENETAQILPEEHLEVPGASAPTRRRPHPRRRRRILLTALVGAGLVYWVAWQSPVTLVEHVVVDAPRGISAESIRLASGISAADRVPSVDAEAVRLGIMTAIPAVADVQLERALPDTIRLAVTARAPLAAVEAGKGYYVMDAEGVVYDKVARAKALPVIKASTDAQREVARGVLLAIPEDLRAKVTRVTARSRDDVTLGLRGGATVRWGGVEDSDLKARVLAGLTAVKATRYDVSAPLLPTTSGSPTEPTSPTG
jgi:cell division protein FtsQ